MSPTEQMRDVPRYKDGNPYAAKNVAGQLALFAYLYLNKAQDGKWGIRRQQVPGRLQGFVEQLISQQVVTRHYDRPRTFTGKQKICYLKLVRSCPLLPRPIWVDIEAIPKSKLPLPEPRTIIEAIPKSKLLLPEPRTITVEDVITLFMKMPMSTPDHVLLRFGDNSEVTFRAPIMGACPEAVFRRLFPGVSTSGFFLGRQEGPAGSLGYSYLRRMYEIGWWEKLADITDERIHEMRAVLGDTETEALLEAVQAREKELGRVEANVPLPPRYDAVKAQGQADVGCNNFKYQDWNHREQDNMLRAAAGLNLNKLGPGYSDSFQV